MDCSDHNICKDNNDRGDRFYSCVIYVGGKYGIVAAVLMGSGAHALNNMAKSETVVKTGCTGDTGHCRC
eukprot:14559521-Ditylum_brightwellii.AAC.1